MACNIDTLAEQKPLSAFALAGAFVSSNRRFNTKRPACNQGKRGVIAVDRFDRHGGLVPKAAGATCHGRP